MHCFMKNIPLVILFLLSPCSLLAQQPKPGTEKKATVKVLVANHIKVPIENEEVSFISVKTKAVYAGRSQKDGRFELEVPAGDTYKVLYNTDSTKEEYADMAIPDAEGVVVECMLTITLGMVFTLDNVFFDTGKASFQPASFAELNELARFMAEVPAAEIEIAGHTDNVGGKEANQKLSQDRANAVKAFLVKKGIAAGRVQAKGYGGTMPVADNTTAEGKKRNRRTEVKILKQ